MSARRAQCRHGIHVDALRSMIGRSAGGATATATRPRRANLVFDGARRRDSRGWRRMQAGVGVRTACVMRARFVHTTLTSRWAVLDEPRQVLTRDGAGCEKLAASMRRRICCSEPRAVQRARADSSDALADGDCCLRQRAAKIVCRPGTPSIAKKHLHRGIESDRRSKCDMRDTRDGGSPCTSH